MTEMTDVLDVDEPGGQTEPQYVPNLDANVLATVKEELAKKEEKQKKHYYLLNELQSMARELPG